MNVPNEIGFRRRSMPAATMIGVDEPKRRACGREVWSMLNTQQAK